MLFRSAVIGFFAILVSYPQLVAADPSSHNLTSNNQGVVVDESQGAEVDATQDIVAAESQEEGVDDTQEIVDPEFQGAELGAAEDIVATESQEEDVDDTQEIVDPEFQEAELEAAEDIVAAESQGEDVDNAQGLAVDNTKGFASSPLQPKYVVNPDGSVTLRICYNWSCWYRETMTFTAEDMELVKRRMSACMGTSLHDRLQRVRIGIWQMESLAQKYQPLLGNDRSINDFDKEAEGRMDCVDNSSNTTTYLHILRDIGELPGWTVSPPEVRKRLDVTAVHWTAVIIDTDSGVPWSIDSWFRPNGHLPMVMPLQSWLAEKRGWETPFDQLNTVPQYINELCPQ